MLIINWRDGYTPERNVAGKYIRTVLNAKRTVFEKNSLHCSVATLKQIPLGPRWTRRQESLSVEGSMTQAEGVDHLTGTRHITLSLSHA